MEVNDEIKNKNISILPLEGARLVVRFVTICLGAFEILFILQKTESLALQGGEEVRKSLDFTTP